MARKRKGPWLRQSDLNWYTTIKGKLVKLGTAQDEPEAVQRAYLAAHGVTRMTVGDLVSAFLEGIQSSCAKRTYYWYSLYSQSFRDFRTVASTPAMDISGAIVSAWISSQYGKMSPSTQHTAARAVTRMYNWAVKSRLFNSSPLVGFQKPKANRREFCITGQQYALCLRIAGPNLKDAIKFLHHTGCRPQELRAIEGKWIADRKVSFPYLVKRSRRVIYLDDMAASIAARLHKRHPDGPIFRNSDGHRWSSSGLTCAFTRLRNRAKLPGLCAYSFRHGYITRLLESKVDPATVAAISGNSPRMVLEFYNHVDQNESRLQGIVSRAAISGSGTH